jgi:NRDE-2, necessary for RNA interference
MEFNFYCPAEIPPELPLDDRLAIFEQFWDCAAPRFGEPGSVGWGNVFRKKSVLEEEKETDTDEFEERLISGSGAEASKASLWLDIERHRSVTDPSLQSLQLFFFFFFLMMANYSY